jgi:cob(I)alamin adenosyltransferase
MDAKLPELHNFILPGGSAPASYTHLARAVCRRVERQIVALNSHPPKDFHLDELVMKDIIKYINRLSDLLFELARFINKQANVEDIPWKGITPKKTR